MAASGTPYKKGLYEVADGIFAYLQPDGGWGWSNAGLIDGGDESLLVDTLFDVKLTEEMLAMMSAVTSTSPINQLINTHANGDHCYGNIAVKRQAETVAAQSGSPKELAIIASAASAAEMQNLPPAALAAMMNADFGPVLNEYLQNAFGAFDFDGIEFCPPTTTFSSAMTAAVGGRPVELIEVGPAHTKGDILVHLPNDGVVFTGDILFIDGTPIVWNGPVSNWVAACDRILAMDATVIVPGHGPLTDADGVRRVRDYLEFVYREATARREAGMTASDAAKDINLGSFAGWIDSERIAINVDSVYRELTAGEAGVPLEQAEVTGIINLFEQMADIKFGR